MKRYSGYTNIDIYNKSFNIKKIKNRKKLQNGCYLEIVALDQYDIPLSLENIPNIFEQNYLSFSFEKISEYSICINNITALETRILNEGNINISISYDFFFEQINSKNESLQLMLEFSECEEGEDFNSLTEECVPCERGIFYFFSFVNFFKKNRFFNDYFLR